MHDVIQNCCCHCINQKRVKVPVSKNTSLCKCSSYTPFKEHAVNGKIVLVCCKQCVISQNANPETTTICHIPRSENHSIQTNDCDSCPFCIIKKMCKNFPYRSHKESMNYNGCSSRSSHKDRKRREHRGRSSEQENRMLDDYSISHRSYTSKSNKPREYPMRSANRDTIISLSDNGNTCSQRPNSNSRYRQNTDDGYNSHPNLRSKVVSKNQKESQPAISQCNPRSVQTSQRVHHKDTMTQTSSKRRRHKQTQAPSNACFRNPREVESTNTNEIGKDKQKDKNLRRERLLNSERLRKNAFETTKNHKSRTDCLFSKRKSDAMGTSKLKKKADTNTGRTATISDIMKVCLEEKDENRKYELQKMKSTCAHRTHNCREFSEIPKMNVCAPVNSSLAKTPYYCYVPICCHTVSQ